VTLVHLSRAIVVCSLVLMSVTVSHQSVLRIAFCKIASSPWHAFLVLYIYIYIYIYMEIRSRDEWLLDTEELTPIELFRDHMQ
jgi:hypothetical protein